MYSLQHLAVSHNATPWVISLDAAIWTPWINFALFNKFHCCSRHFLEGSYSFAAIVLSFYFISPLHLDSPLYLRCASLPQSIIEDWEDTFPYHLIFLRCAWLGDTRISPSDLSDIIPQHYILKVLSDRFSWCPFNSHTGSTLPVCKPRNASAS